MLLPSVYVPLVEWYIRGVITVQRRASVHRLAAALFLVALTVPDYIPSIVFAHPLLYRSPTLS